MEPKLFSLCAVLVLSYVHVSCQVDDRCYNTSTHQHCFKSLGNILLNFSTAVANCTGAYSLVAVADEEVRQVVTRFVMESELTSDDIWLGIKRTTDGVWKQVDGSIYTGHNIDAPTENLTSVYIKFDSSSNQKTMHADVSYATNRYYICQFDGQDRCQQFSTRTTTNFGCYVKFPINNDRAKLPWYEARNKCLFHNGDLAHSDVLNNTRLILESEDYWIGINRDPLMWINNSDTSKYSQVKYSYFLRGQPSVYNMNTTCIVMSFSSQWAWSSKSCSENQLVVCQSVRMLPTENERSTTSGTDSTKTTTTSSSSSTETTTLSPGAVGGIIAGCIAFYILSIVVAVVIACCCRKKGSGKATKESDPSSNGTNEYHREPSGRRRNHIDGFEANEMRSDPAQEYDDVGPGYIQPRPHDHHKVRSRHEQLEQRNSQLEYENFQSEYESSTSPYENSHSEYMNSTDIRR